MRVIICQRIGVNDVITPQIWCLEQAEYFPANNHNTSFCPSTLTDRAMSISAFVSLFDLLSFVEYHHPVVNLAGTNIDGVSELKASSFHCNYQCNFLRTTMAGRTIKRIVSPTIKGPMHRLIGTVDVDGNGTNHPLADCDPFMLLDHAVVPKPNAPPFGAHPHRGHSVVTILLQGRVKSWDSYHPTDENTVLEGPASYWVDAGSGVFHNETSVMDDPTDPTQHMEVFQLWISVKEEDRKKKPAVQYDSHLPVVDALDVEGNIVGSVRYFVGGGGAIKPPHPITVARIIQNGGTTLKYPIDSTHGGFVVHTTGRALYGDEAKEVSSEDDSIHVLADAKDSSEGYLQVTTQTDEQSVYLVCTGEQIKEPWCKKLIANGAVVAKDENEAREIASRVELYSKEGLSSGNFAPFGDVPRGLMKS